MEDSSDSCHLDIKRINLPAVGQIKYNPIGLILVRTKNISLI